MGPAKLRDGLQCRESETATNILDPNPKDGIYTVTVPALPGCITQGRDVEECIARAKEAIAVWLADAEDHGEPIPDETMRPLVVTIGVAP